MARTFHSDGSTDPARSAGDQDCLAFQQTHGVPPFISYCGMMSHKSKSKASLIPAGRRAWRRDRIDRNNPIL
jgi:hypothetical protein